MKWRWLPAVLIVTAACGPSAHQLREQTLSVLNTEADRWDGGKEFGTGAVDAYGRPLACGVRKTTLSYVLEIRSFGPDGLPKNSDDIVVSRSKRHGETTLTEEAAKAAERAAEATASGAVKGVKKQFGMDGGKK